MEEGFNFLNAIDGGELKDYSHCIVKDEMNNTQIDSNRVASIFNFKKKLGGARNSFNQSTDPMGTCYH